jgi:hypothetical protein
MRREVLFTAYAVNETMNFHFVEILILEVEILIHEVEILILGPSKSNSRITGTT